MIQAKHKRYSELMLGLMSGTIIFLHDFGYSEANAKTLFTEPIYATALYNQVNKIRGKAKDTDMIIVCNYLISRITCEYGNVKSNPLHAHYAKNRDIIGCNKDIVTIVEVPKHEWWNV